MSLLNDAMRNIGLMFHNFNAELEQGKAKPEAQVHEHSRKVEEEQPAPGVTIRRTTVEEIILAPGVDPASLKQKSDH